MNWMVRLSFWDNFFKKESKPEVMDSGEARNLLQDMRARESKKILDRARPLIEGILTSVSRIDSVVADIDESSIPDDTAVKLKRIAETSKSPFVTGLRDSINPLLNRKVSDYTDIKQLHMDLRNMLDSLARVHMGQGRYLPMIFDAEVKEIKKESKNLLHHSDSIGELVKSSTGESALDKALNRFYRMDSCLDEIESMKSLLKEKRDKLDSLRAREKNLIDENEKFSISKEVKELTRMMDERRVIDEKLHGLESKVYQLLTPLKRPLRKYRKQAFELDKLVLNRVDGFIDEPVKQFFSGEGELGEILKKLGGYVRDGKLGLKERERKKTEEKIGNLMDADLDLARMEYDSLLKEKNSLTESISRSRVMGKKESLKSSLDSAKSEIGLIKGELVALEGKTKELSEEVDDLRDEIRVEISKIKGGETRINWS
ncbi:MAG: hypothetical protein U9M95_05090 [Candidatus Altiarchaeota archaeon]|nr:hypothetical protein [Candidatus Altiarchaeota archaeon]